MRLAETDKWTTAEVNIHTRVNPYCGNWRCWCHTDATYHETVMHARVTDEEVMQAYGFLGLLHTGVLQRETIQNSVR
jgi:hypothetical protein